MRKVFYILLLAFLTVQVDGAAQSKHYSVVFYNVENLFDTIKSPGVLDDEFTPAGANKWDGDKYWKKMANLEKVFLGIAATANGYPAIIGLAEVENRNVLEDLVSVEKLRIANYQIVHYDSPDARGIDVALFYRPDQFKYEGSVPIRVALPSEPNFRTRDILCVWGSIEGEEFCFFVCHFPSRTGGEQTSEYRRIAAAQTLRDAADSIMAARPGIKLVAMGDMNDDPNNRSLYTVLGAKGKEREVRTDTDFFNPYYEMYRKGFGTLAYNDAWNLFDNIIVNGALLNAGRGALKLVKPAKGKYYGNIFKQPFMLQQSGQYKNYPLRTFVGNNFMNGYSDHFPVYILIAK